MVSLFIFISIVFSHLWIFNVTKVPSCPFAQDEMSLIVVLFVTVWLPTFMIISHALIQAFSAGHHCIVSSMINFHVQIICRYTHIHEKFHSRDSNNSLV
jgi:hypothetical protein